MKKKANFIFPFILVQLIILNNLQFARGDSSREKIIHFNMHRVPKTMHTIISVDLAGVPLAKALSIVAGKGKFKLNYNRNRIPVNQKVSVKMNNVPSVQVLLEILKDTGAELKIIKGSHVAVVPKKKKSIVRGTIAGKVGERSIKRVIPGVFVQIENTGISTLSNDRGEFKIPGVPPGNYIVKLSAGGFKPVRRAAVSVNPGRVTDINVKMRENPFDIRETIDITAGYFHKSDKNPNSVFNISAEEVRRAPGTMGDVSRMLTSLPGITFITDDVAELIIRGGCPLENGFYIDNIEVPHINHTPAFGTSGGPYSAINPGVIRNVDFFTGGFSADYGGRLSSVTDITLREGNRKKLEQQIDVNTAMAGGVFEGPIANGKGALIISLRKSYLKFLQESGLMDFGNRIFDTFDSQVKLTVDINPRHKISLLNLYEHGSFNEYDQYIHIKDIRKFTQNTIGISLVSNWSERFFSNTSLSYSSVKRTDGEIYSMYSGGGKIWESDDAAAFFSLRNSNVLTVNQRNRFEFGFQVKHESDKLAHNIFQPGNLGEKTIKESRSGLHYFTTRYSLYLSYIAKPLK
ncbi:MAG: TonB-dependent receptor, partial [bacterium]|nr:TonB-dependent receptor [bacterium]